MSWSKFFVLLRCSIMELNPCHYQLSGRICSNPPAKYLICTQVNPLTNKLNTEPPTTMSIYSIVTTLDVTVEYWTLVSRDMKILSRTEEGSEQEALRWKVSISILKEFGID